MSASASDHGFEVGVAAPARRVPGAVRPGQVDERQVTVIRAQLPDRGGHQRFLAREDGQLVDGARPCPPPHLELVLAGEDRAAAAGLVDRGEDRRGACRHRTGRGVVPGDAVPAVRGVDPHAGHHAGVVRQGDRLLHLGAGVESAGTLRQQVDQGRCRRLADPQRPEPVDGDHHHPWIVREVLRRDLLGRLPEPRIGVRTVAPSSVGGGRHHAVGGVVGRGELGRAGRTGVVLLHPPQTAGRHRDHDRDQREGRDRTVRVR